AAIEENGFHSLVGARNSDLRRLARRLGVRDSAVRTHTLEARKERGRLPELFSRPFGGLVIMALSAFKLHANEELRRGSGQVLRLVFLGQIKPDRRGPRSTRIRVVSTIAIEQVGRQKSTHELIVADVVYKLTPQPGFEARLHEAKVGSARFRNEEI